MTAAPISPAPATLPGEDGPGMDRVMASSSWMFATMVLMSVSGVAFWFVAARLFTPADVGYAGTLITALVVLALFAQVGLEATLVQVLPTSSRPAADVWAVVVVVSAAGALLGAGYAAALGWFAPELADVLHGGLGVATFSVLVAGAAVNAVSDSALLAVSRLRANLVINGVVLSVLKLALLVVLVSWGGVGPVLAFGVSAVVAAVLSIVVVLRALGTAPAASSASYASSAGRAPRRLRPSRELLEARRFAGAGYVVSVLDVAPTLVFPALVIAAHGAAVGGAYNLAFQTMLMLLAVGFSLNNAMYAEASRSPGSAAALVRRSGLIVAGALSAGAVVLVVAAPLVMRIFGEEYVDAGTPLLRVLALAAVASGLASWSALRLRVAGRLRAMLVTYALGTVLVVVLALWWVDLGPWGVALALAVGRAVTLLLNLVLGVRR